MDGMMLVVVTIAGVTLVSPNPVTPKQCDDLKAEQPTTLCVDVAPACEGKKQCLLDDAPATPRASSSKKRRHVHRSRAVVATAKPFVRPEQWLSGVWPRNAMAQR